MKILLRSMMVGSPTENSDSAFKNFLSFNETNLSFDLPEDNTLYQFIKIFSQTHNHSPSLQTIRNHFEHIKEVEVVDRLEVIGTYSPVANGDFIKRAEEKVDEQRQRQVTDLLKEASVIMSTGLEIREGKDTRHMRGASDAIKYLLSKSHEIVTPIMGSRLSGEITNDGGDFITEYDRVKLNPTAGIGQYAGIQQIDDSLGGAKKGELWTHAAFTGQLKCVTGETRIFDTKTGCLRTVKELFDSKELPTVHALDEASWSITSAEASIVAENGVRPILKIETDKGRSIRVSGNHPFMTTSGWVDADKLTPGMWVATPGSMPYSGPSRFSDAEVSLLGYLIGDGYLGSSISITSSSAKSREHIKECLNTMGLKETHGNGKQQIQPRFREITRSDCKSDRRKKNKMIEISRRQNTSYKPPSEVYTLLSRLGLYGLLSGQKHIPNELWAIEDRQVWLLLSSLWATDGSIHWSDSRPAKPEANLWYGSKSKQLIEDIQLLLQRVGVPSSVSVTHTKYKGEKYLFYVVKIITCEGKIRFLENTHIPNKNSMAQKILQRLKSKKLSHEGDLMPTDLMSHIDNNVRIKTRSGGWQYSRWVKKRSSVTRGVLGRFADSTQDAALQAKVAGNIRWEMLRSITSDGQEMTYDLSVPGPANFVANGFITHNTSFMMTWAYNQAVYYLYDSLIFSLEMPYAQCRRILYAMHSMHEKFTDVRIGLGIQKDTAVAVGLEYGKIRDGMLNDKEEQFLRQHVVPDFNSGEYGKIHIEVADPDKSDFTLMDAQMRAEMIYNKSPFHLLYLDHAGLLAPRKWVSSTTERLNEVIRDAKRLAMKFNKGQGIPVISLFQLNREGFKSAEKNGGIYNLTALAYSNENERSSDIITTTYLSDEMRKKARVQFQCLKSRDQKPFETFQAHVDWNCRRILTSFEVQMIQSQNEEIKKKLDELA